MVGLVHGQGVARRCGEGLASQGFADFVDVGGLGFFHRLGPHVDANIRGFHRVVGHRFVGARQVLGLGVGFPGIDEFLVRRVIHGLEVVPRRQVAHQWLGVDAAQFFLAHRERHDRYIGGLQTLVRQFFVERHVGVAVDGGDDCGLAAGRELLDVGDDGLVIAVAERGVDLFDVFVRHAFGVQERTQDLVGGTRVDVVGAQQEVTLGAAAFFAHQVFHGRNRLLVWRCAGVEHVRRHFFAFILHRVEQQAVEFFEHRQHGFTRHRSPAAEHHGDLVLGQQLPALFGEQRPVRRRVHDHRFELLAVDPTLGVDLIDGHQRHVLEGRLGDRHGPGQRMQDANLDGLGGLDGPSHAHRGNACRECKSLDQATTLHGAISVVFMFFWMADADAGRGFCKGCARLEKGFETRGWRREWKMAMHHQ